MQTLRAYNSFFATQSRHAILFGGAGSGKSMAAAQKVILQALQHPGARILCIRKFRAGIRHSVWALLVQILEQTIPTQAYRTAISTLSIHFFNGSQILCLGLDDPEKIKSIQGISSIWVEEATELKEQDFAQLELRVRGKTAGYKQFTLTFNPTDQSHWLHKRFFQTQPEGTKWTGHDLSLHQNLPPVGTGRDLSIVPSQNNPVGTGRDLSITPSQNQIEASPPPASPTLFTLHTTYLQNSELDQAYREHLEQALKSDENLYRIYTLGQWGHVRTGGAFYKNFSMARHVATNPYNPNLPLHISFDFNLHPYMTATVWQIEHKERPDARGQMLEEGAFSGISPLASGLFSAFQIAEFCLSSPQNTTRDVCNALLAAYPQHHTSAYIYGDPTGSHASPLTDARTTHYTLIQEQLAVWQPRMRVARSAPGLVQRGLFINAMLSGNIDEVDISIDPGCTRTLQDYQNLQEDASGAKLKTIAKDAQTGIRSQTLGHCSDANDYLLCEAFYREFTKFNRGGRELIMPILGR